MDAKSTYKIEQKIKKLRVDLSYVESDMIAGNLSHDVISKRNSLLVDIATLEGQLKDNWNKGYEPEGYGEFKKQCKF